MSATMSSRCFVRTQRRWQNGNTKAWRTDLPTYGLTGVGARDACVSKNLNTLLDSIIIAAQSKYCDDHHCRSEWGGKLPSFWNSFLFRTPAVLRQLPQLWIETLSSSSSTSLPPSPKIVSFWRLWAVISRATPLFLGVSQCLNSSNLHFGNLIPPLTEKGLNWPETIISPDQSSRCLCKMSTQDFSLDCFTLWYWN